MKEKLHRLSSQVHNNRGVGLVTVVIAVAFLIVLGSLILFTSYSGVRERTSAREGEEQFYDAETAMNLIQAGLQKTVSDAFKSAYTAVLEDYTEENAALFSEHFYAAIADASFLNMGETESTYNFSGLQNYLADTEYADYTTVGTSDPEAEVGEIEVDMVSVPQTITLKDVRVSCSYRGRTNAVTADLKMTIPDMYFVDTKYNISGVTTFDLVAEEGIEVFSSDAGRSAKDEAAHIIHGNAYAGKVNVTGTSLMSEGGMLVCGGEIGVTNGEYILAPMSNLWTDGVTVNGQATVDLRGEANVADDLNLSGNGASAILSGRYSGFGSSLDNSEQSSAIFANGRDTNLYMTQSLEYFMLAGYSFIDLDPVGSGAGIRSHSSNVRMGESISAKSNQQLYLVPASSIRYNDGGTLASVSSNPLVTSEGEARKMLQATIRTTDELLTGADVKVAAHSIGDQWVVYFFMEFKDPEEAGDYFKNYFTDEDNTVNADRMNAYLDSYLSVARARKLNTNPAKYYPDSFYTAGVSFTNTNLLGPDENTGEYSDGDAPLKIFDSAITGDNSLRSTYDNLCATLTTYSASADKSITPYRFIVSDEAALWAMLDSADPMYFYPTSSPSAAPVAVVTTGSFTYTGSDSQKNISLIIAEGDVTVDCAAGFSGLILCKGTIHLKSGDITVDSLAVSQASQGVAYTGEGDGRTPVLYNNKPLTAGAFLNQALATDDNSGSENAKSYDVVVTLENWRKA